MNNKTDDMSELVETLRAAAEKAEPITTDLFGDRYFTGVWSTATLDKNQDDFIALASPANILKLLSSLPLSGAAGETTVNQELLAACKKALSHHCGCRSSRKEEWHAEQCAVPQLKVAIARAEALHED